MPTEIVLDMIKVSTQITDLKCLGPTEKGIHYEMHVSDRQEPLHVYMDGQYRKWNWRKINEKFSN